jgi:hypothetical protein
VTGRESRPESKRARGEHEVLHTDEDRRVGLRGRAREDEDRRFPEVTGQVPGGFETPRNRRVGHRLLLVVAK